MIAIQQVTITQFPQPITANRCEVPTIAIVPGATASGSVVLGNESEPDAEGNTRFVPIQGAITVAMTEPQYKAWGLDDDYAVNCLLKNLGLVRV